MADFKGLVNSGKDFIDKRSPEILIGCGIAGMISTTVLAVKATPKAIKLMEQAEDEKDDYLTTTEKIKAAWKPYVPAAVTGVISIGCIIGAQSINAKRTAALATAYKLSEEAMTLYKQKVIETIGESKEKQVRDKVAEEKVKQNPVSATTIIESGQGKTLCLDAVSGQYFHSDMETLRRAQNNFNAQLLSQDFLSLNEFYDEIGIRHTTMGDEIGWNIGKDGMIDLDFSSQITESGEPCLVIDYRVQPRHGFGDMY